MRRWLSLLLVFLLVSAMLSPVRASAAATGEGAEAGAFWKQEADYAEIAVKPYPSYTYYSELPGILREIETSSNRVKVEVMGQSALGRDLFLVTVSEPTTLGNLGRYQALRNTMLRDPAKAQQMVDQGAQFKVPIFINASIHGSETTGVDAALRFLRHLAFDDDEEVRAILANTIVLINIDQNPDGRISDKRPNGNGFDVNRDFITLSQPEAQATQAAIARWKPAIFLDLHGFVNPMLIEPCTVPHNPNYEYDLYIKWALAEAEAMRTAVEANTPFAAEIPALDYSEGWDDYPPIFTPMFAMYYGAIGHTLETPKKTEDGVNAHYYAITAAAKFAAANKLELFHDQIEIFRRGVESIVQPDITFPYAYVIPADAAHQKSPLQAARAVEQLLTNEVQVQQAVRPFTAGGVSYPAGTYVVPMDQPLRALANTMLWDGQDISYQVSDMYDISAWSLPESWGFDALSVDTPFAVAAVDVTKPSYPAGGVKGRGPAYLLQGDSNNAVRAVNTLLNSGYAVSVAPQASGGLAVGTFVIPADQQGLQPALSRLASQEHVTFTAAAPDELDGAEVKSLRQPRVAVYGDAAVTFVLRGLGFDVTAIGPADSLEGYDVLVGAPTSSRAALPAGVVPAFVQAGGAYIGVGAYGVSGDAGGLLPVTWAAGSSNDNGIVRATYNAAGLVAAGYPAADYAFVYKPLWFDSVGAGVQVDAAYATGDFFLAGFWPDRAAAAGKPAVVSGSYGQGHVVYCGFQPAFRAHPENTFRLLSGAIFFGLQ